MIIIQSLVQIILESLPISSSGHQELLQKIVHWPPLAKSFEYVLHAPTIIVLVVYFQATWMPLLVQCWRFRAVIGHMLAYAFVANFVTAFIYIGVQIYVTQFPLWLGFAMTACMLLSLRWVSYRCEALTLKKLFIIGCVQGIAGLPGISRLAATSVVGVWLGLPTHKSFSISCMLQFPLICAGFLYGLKETYGTEYFSFITQPIFCILAILATIVAYLLLWLVNYYLEQRRLWKTSIYMFLPFFLALFFL